ncbi:hypothetical protein [Streptomyces olivochromogenes]|uniref:hypothetical protein n=1 Tax=Streptomyces olivochromogenes TaxID=1963 RepID=UPI001F24ABF7|nr:hypothetical protein [Streptomyces olivochromogenes]MCF3133173.1 hypothetical protein [Streptomyces olivochromogenes]
MQWISLIAVSLPGLAALAALLFTWMQVGQASTELRIAEEGLPHDGRPGRPYRGVDQVDVLRRLSTDTRVPWGTRYCDERVAERTSSDCVAAALAAAEPDRVRVAALRYSARHGTDHGSHAERNAAVGPYVRWRNVRAEPKALTSH